MNHRIVSIVRIFCVILLTALLNACVSPWPYPISECSPDRDIEKIEECIRTGNINASLRRETTPLMLAALYGRKDLVNTILSQGGKIDACNQDGWTALMFAASANQYEVLELLLERGADVNIRAKNGSTALLVAFVFDYNKTAEILLEKSANPNFFYDNYKGNTLLMITIEHNSIKHIRLLLQHGTDVNSVTQKTGNTALMKAILYANKEIITLLLDNDADIEAGKSAWDTLSCHSEACIHDYKGMRDLLLKYSHQTPKKVNSVPF